MLAEQLKTLPEMDRLKIVDYLLESLDIPSQEVERLWVAESQDRYEAYMRGEIPSVPIEEALAKYRK